MCETENFKERDIKKMNEILFVLIKYLKLHASK